MPADSELFEVAYAKINLALHVRSRRTDGYHELNTIFAFVDDGDHLTVTHSDDMRLTISGPFAADLSNGKDNLVLKTAHLLRDHFKPEGGASINLNKRLPIASGIGGGSADAAATARALNRLWKIGASNAELAKITESLGADIPACVFSELSLGQGIGTRLSPLEPGQLAGSNILLINPNKPVATAQVFAAWDGVDRGGFAGEDVADMMLSGRNDLQKAAISLCPEIETILNALDQYSPVLARMSGSGATCFALFSGEVECSKVRLALQTQNPEWWFMQGHLR